MSQAGDISATSGPVPPSVATEYDTNDSHFAVPFLNILNVYGNDTASPENTGYQSYSTSSGNTVFINTYGTAKWVVNPIAGLGTHTTIASALASASSGDTIFITPGTYTENFTFVPGVNLTSFTQKGQDVSIVGNLTISASGTYNISNIGLQSIISFTSSDATVNISNCNIGPSTFAGSFINFLSTSANASLNFYQCIGNITSNTLFTGSSPGTISFYDCFINSTTNTSVSTLTVGNVFLYDSYFNLPLGSSGTGGITCINTYINSNIPSGSTTTGLTISGTGTNLVANSILNSGNQPAITCSATASVNILNSSISSSSANAISGTGTINSAGITYYGSSSTNGANVQIPRVISNDAIKVVSPGAYPYTPSAQDALVLVDSSSARSIVPQGSPTTGQKHIIKDNTGSAGANNITITPSGKNIDGAASYVINVNYGSVTIVYNGTQWNVV